MAIDCLPLRGKLLLESFAIQLSALYGLRISVGVTEYHTSLRVIWSDADLLEVEASFAFRDWSAVGSAYATRSDLIDFADALDRVVLGGSAAELSLGQPDLGYASCRVFEYGGPRHLAMVVTIGVGHKGIGQPQDTGRESRLSVPIERGQLTAFAQSLRRIARDERGTARLPLPPDWP
jgi:hypothetical protein